MRNLTVFFCIVFVLVIAVIIGAIREDGTQRKKEKIADVPHIGSIQVLNGCGAEGAANKVADYLREQNFDVKSIGNANTWNYPFTMVIARSTDTTVASQVAKALGTAKLVVVRTSEQLYDATVMIGPDFEERIR